MLRERPLVLFLIWLLAVLACGLAAAQPNGPAHVANEPAYIVSQRDCDSLVAAAPRSDVIYHDGVDVNGRSVAPADLPGSSRVHPPNAIPVVIHLYPGSLEGLPARRTEDLTRTRAGGRIPADSTLNSSFFPEVMAGEIVVVRRPTGHDLFFNGQPLTDPTAAQMRDACARRPAP